MMQVQTQSQYSANAPVIYADALAFLKPIKIVINFWDQDGQLIIKPRRWVDL